jgi:hypothetical protein
VLTLRARSHAGCAESIILIVALSKGLANIVIANNVLVVVVGNVVVIGVLVVIVITALSKGLVVAVIANGILAIGIVTLLGLGNSKSLPSLYF